MDLEVVRLMSPKTSIAIVMLVVVKQGVSLLWGGLGLVLLMIIFMIAIKIYKAIRMKTDSSV